MSAIAPNLTATTPRPFTDSLTMLRRVLRRALRYPGLTVGVLLVPVVILLLFAGLLGRPLGAGIGVQGEGGYINYLAPGVFLITVASGCTSSAVAVCVDLTSGIVDRFRTLPISRGAFLTGHVLASLVQTAISTVLVIGAAVLMGFRPQGNVLDWLAAFGLLMLMALAITWLAVLIGLRSPNPEAASNTPLLVQLLPFVSSSFIPTETMPTAVRWFAAYQPFTPLAETLRALLQGRDPGSDAVVAVLWCLAVGVLAYAAAARRFAEVRKS